MTESALEWPKFCYSHNIPCEDASKRIRLDLLRPKAVKAAPVNDLDEFAFSNLMKRMAEKYNNVDEEKENKGLPPSAHFLGNSYFLPYFHPFLFPAQPQPPQPLQSSQPSQPLPSANLPPQPLRVPSPLGSDGGCTTTSSSSLSSSSAAAAHSPLDLSSTAAAAATWDVEDVCRFVASVESCAEYEEVFRDHSIDGSSLLVLTESHLIGILGLRLGPAIRLLGAIRQLS